VDDDDDDTARN